MFKRLSGGDSLAYKLYYVVVGEFPVWTCRDLYIWCTLCNIYCPDRRGGQGLFRGLRVQSAQVPLFRLRQSFLSTFMRSHTDDIAIP